MDNDLRNNTNDQMASRETFYYLCAVFIFSITLLLWVTLFMIRPTPAVVRDSLITDPTPTPGPGQVEMLRKADFLDPSSELVRKYVLFNAAHQIPTPAETTPESTPQATIVPVPTPAPSQEEEETGWMYYLATGYDSDKLNPCGNRGELLTGRKAIAMWQSDTDYSKYPIIEPFRSFLTDPIRASLYGALPYGTKVEMRYWNQLSKSYINLGTFEVLDDSPTTIYNLSEIAHNLSGPSGPLYFPYTWHSIDYRGNPQQGGRKYGYIANWREEYSGKISGWLDIWQGHSGMIIVEIRIVD